MGLDSEARMKTSKKIHTKFSISEYASGSALTDQLEKDALIPVRLGLFGEVGSLMAASKKYHRERKAYAAYKNAVVDEFGDTLWYLAALCRRLECSLEEVVSEASQGDDVSTNLPPSTFTFSDVSTENIKLFAKQETFDKLLLCLGHRAAMLLKPCENQLMYRERIISFTRAYLRAIQAYEIPLESIMRTNLMKTRGRFLDPDFSNLIDFDVNFPEEERLPYSFRIEIKQRKRGRSYLRWNGVFIGDPLVDNINDPDGYRFHDVFHFAHAAILHWSPAFRALIRQKRKSDPRFDESEDGGRAIVIEEGLTAYVFARAKELNFFENQSSISFDILKTIENFVRGYEVERCPLKLWEKAILQGYSVFRCLRANNGGTILGDRSLRTILYESSKSCDS